MKKLKKVVVIGGGTGSYTLLNDLKYLPINLTAIVNMSDNGGSTGILRDQLGVLPPGDIRQCLVGLSTDVEFREMFNYRFGKGSFKGHTLGNIILSGLSLKYDSFAKAIAVASKILDIKGSVVPITLDESNLALKDGQKIINGQIEINRHTITNKNHQLFFNKPLPTINPFAELAIKEADLIIIAPGDFYGSILPIFITDTTAKLIHQSKAKIIQIINLVTRSNDTLGWGVTNYLTKIEQLIGKNRVDFCLYNTSMPKPTILKQYASEDEYPVRVDFENFKLHQATKFIGKDLISNKISLQNPNDILPRTLIRHDGLKATVEIKKILKSIKD